MDSLHERIFKQFQVQYVLFDDSNVVQDILVYDSVLSSIISSSHVADALLSLLDTRQSFDFPHQNLIYRFDYHAFSQSHLYRISDVTHDRHFSSHTRRPAAQDTLTGLYRRSVLHARAEQLISQNRPFHVIFIDLNSFKHVNDTLGHAAGDNVLRLCARAIQRQLRPSDLLVRLGGDEFCALLSDVRSSQSAHIIQLRIQSAVLDAASAFSVSAAIGLSAFPADALQFDRLLEIADSRMYAHKRSAAV